MAGKTAKPQSRPKSGAKSRKKGKKKRKKKANTPPRRISAPDVKSGAPTRPAPAPQFPRLAWSRSPVQKPHSTKKGARGYDRQRAKKQTRRRVDEGSGA
jgi:hypothetical protein